MRKHITICKGEGYKPRQPRPHGSAPGQIRPTPRRTTVLVGVTGLLGLFLVAAAGGCTYLPVPGPAVVRPPEQFWYLADGRLGAAHGYVVGVAKERLSAPTAEARRGQSEQAVLASMDAETLPLPPAATEDAPTADLNDDGFVTLDEVIALHRYGLDGPEIARRLTATGFVLAATDPQLRHLRAYGVPESALAPLMGKM